MITTLFGFKLGQTRVFTEDGSQIPVTRIAVAPSVVTRVIDTLGDKRYQLGLGEAKRLSKPTEGIMKKAGVTTKPRFLREVSVEALDEKITLGSRVTVAEVFAVGDAVEVSGVAKGKGFAGGVKRHGFSGGPKTHGQGDRHRAPGSIGAGTTPGRVYRGKHMAGRLGGQSVTMRGFSVVSVDSEHNILTVKGLIPGAKNSIVKIQKQG